MARWYWDPQGRRGLNAIGYANVTLLTLLVAFVIYAILAG